MDILKLLFLPGILAIGFLGSLSDIKTGKVSNNLIKKGFFYGLIIYFFLFLWTIARKSFVFLTIFLGNTYYLTFNYFIDLFINTLIAFIVGIVLWKLNFWAAGDAKLFALMSFLLPLTAYTHNRIVYFPSFILLLNSYIICLFWLIFKEILKFKIKKINLVEIYNNNKEKIKIFLKNISRNFQLNKTFIFLNLILIYSIIFLFISSFAFRINVLNLSLPSSLFCYLCLFAVYQPLTKLFKKYEKINTFVFLFLIAISFLVPNFWAMFFSRAFLRFSSGFLVFIVIIRIAAIFLNRRDETRKIKLDNLQPNMILSDRTISLLKEDKNFFQKEIAHIYFDGLSIEQVKKIKNFFKNKNMQEIEISRTFPFAPFIFLGALSVYFFGGSII